MSNTAPTGHMDRQRILITGGSRGIGAATAKRLAADGHDIVLTYRNRAEDARKVQRDCESFGASVDVYQCDFSDPDQVRGLLPRILLDNPHLTGLVNNAGITNRIGPFTDDTEPEWRELFEVNVFAVLELTQQIIKHLLNRSGNTSGCIVNVSSGAATSGAPGAYVPYAMSKAAIDALTKGLAAEFGPMGIRVNSVQPGTTDTEIHAAGGAPNAIAERSPRIPLRRAATPDEIAGSIAYFFTPDAGYTSGAVLRIGGGL